MIQNIKKKKDLIHQAAIRHSFDKYYDGLLVPSCQNHICFLFPGILTKTNFKLIRMTKRRLNIQGLQWNANSTQIDEKGRHTRECAVLTSFLMTYIAPPTNHHGNTFGCSLKERPSKATRYVNLGFWIYW